MAALTSENNFQASLAKDINDYGGYAYKASNMYTTGVPDLAITPGITYPRDIKIECKFLKVPSTMRKKKVELSPPQAAHIRRTIQAGGIALWVVGYTLAYKPGWGMFLLGVGHDGQFSITKEHIAGDHPAHIRKERGKPWPVERIFDQIFRSFDLVSDQEFLNGKPSR